MKIKRDAPTATVGANPSKSDGYNTSKVFKISTKTECSIIESLLLNVDAVWEIPPAERVDILGTTALEILIYQEHRTKNARQRIGALRERNGGEQALPKKDVPEARTSPYGRPPVHYYIPRSLNQKWREAVVRFKRAK